MDKLERRLALRLMLVIGFAIGAFAQYLAPLPLLGIITAVVVLGALSIIVTAVEWRTGKL